MTEKVYDILAIIGRIILPALGTLYFAVAKIWNLPLASEITGTLAALTAFLNSVLKIQSAEFFNDHEIVEKGEDDDDSDLN